MIFKRKSTSMHGKNKKRIMLYLYLMKNEMLKLHKCDFEFVF